MWGDICECKHPQMPETLDHPGAGAGGLCEPPLWVLAARPGPLREQDVLFTKPVSKNLLGIFASLITREIAL